MSKNKIYRGDNNSDKLIELIREMGGTVFVDPCPTPKPIDNIVRFLTRLIK